MKRILQIVLVMTLGFGIAACASESTTTSSTTIQTTASTTASQSTTSTTTSSATTTSTALREFTLSELSAYNGNDGADAFIAVNGVVYDVTNADGWENGWHQDLHLAGTDATAAFAGSPHSASLLDTLPIVGSLSE